jgi:glycosyltransferase involved in cell wall biosynthesis
MWGGLPAINRGRSSTLESGRGVEDADAAEAGVALLLAQQQPQPAVDLEVDRRLADGRLRISVVIPALNEAKNLPHVLSRLPSCVYEVILVDGRSTDDTVRVARSVYPRIRVLTQGGRGKGDALVCGFAACRGDIVVMLDADGSGRPEEIPRFVDALLHGADMAKGSRFADGGGSADMTPLRRVGNGMIGGLVNVLFGTHYTDLCYGYNAFWARALGQLRVQCAGFEVETLINVRAAKAGLRIVEVPSFEDPRIYGTSNLRAFRDGLRIVRVIMRERVRRGWPTRMPAVVDTAPWMSASPR